MNRCVICGEEIPKHKNWCADQNPLRISSTKPVTHSYLTQGHVYMEVKYCVNDIGEREVHITRAKNCVPSTLKVLHRDFGLMPQWRAAAIDLGLAIERFFQIGETE